MGKIKKWVGNYTTVPNTWLKDTRLSARAKGVMCFLQSVNDNWIYSVKGLATQFSEGERAIESAIKELKDAGYLVWKRERLESGTLGKTVVELVEYPDNQPSRRNPGLDKPNLDKPDLDNDPQQTNNIQTNNIQTKEQQNNLVEIQSIYDYYLKCFSVNGNKYKLTPKRASKIGARLKEFSADDIEKAIENAFRDDFYGGKKTSWKADLDYIVRSYENTEKLANLESGKMVVTYSIYNDPRYKTVDQLHPEVVLTDEERKRKLDSIAELKKNFLKGKLGGRI